ncbi:uncharacterized protein LOC142488115 [Ascaphus truei]|uniref:uncharacterized protein LOC142488115 n=1 Tax=Ascaphus truei TaxID=8439 RepID=UPI003F5AA0AE
MQVDPKSQSNTNKTVSAMDFYANRIMIRHGTENHILHCRQLFHQFIVDMYAKIESERLLYIRLHQKELRVDQYIHLKDAVVNDGNIDNIGKILILPASFTGSPRHMHEYAQDAMSYVRAYGRPDFFITFTCNPSWTEIKQQLYIGQAPSDRHDLVARVFKLKLQKLMYIITKNHIFGQTRCWIYSIEWQKRGLPHAHILIWLKEKLHPIHIDKVISAELPNQYEDPILFAIVTKNMIHGPCGNININSPCMKEGICTKKFPKQFLLDTQSGDDGYPRYQRRAPSDGGYTATIHLRNNCNIQVDNKWIVPYSPLLSKTFNAHINVEYCNPVKSIKYICKYVNKGSDMAIFGITNENMKDEISLYQLGRYISSNEAVWRIFSFPIHQRHPTVVHLTVHLENGQRVYFTPHNAQSLAAQPPNTTLTAFFQLCQNDSFAKTLLYPDIPKYYTWNSSTKQFKKWKNGVRIPGEDAIQRGTGKTFLINLLLAEIRMEKNIALAIASSGIAATLMDGGRTVHSALKLPLNIANEENPTCNITKTSGQARVLQTCKLIVWDECTMAHKKSLEALDRTLKDLRNNQDIMGGAVILLAGESNTQDFANMLLNIGEGTLPTNLSGEITFPNHFAHIMTSLTQLINHGYPNIVHNYNNHTWLCERAILAPKNNCVNDINNQIQDMLPGNITEYKSIDTVVDTDEAVNYPTEFLNSLEPPGMPPHRLRLKLGSPIMLLRNLNTPNLCNGTRLCIKSLMPNLIEATILTGKATGEDVFIPRIPLIPTDMPFNFKCLQFPVRLAFAITINKSQGQSIKCTGINLQSPCFSHGQLYVACSRVGSSNDLYILAPNGSTKNVVYKQALQ